MSINLYRRFLRINLKCFSVITSSRRCRYNLSSFTKISPLKGYLGQFLNSHDELKFIKHGFTSESRNWTCWNCGNEVVNSVFSCEKCGCIVEPCHLETVSYFRMLKQKESFVINTHELTKEFRNLQRYLHPDKFGRKSKKEQELSEEVSSLVNKAYQTILRPMERASYLLEINGKPFDEKAVQMEASFLADIMEVNEAVSECSTAEEAIQLKALNDKQLVAWYEALALSFKENDLDAALRSLAKLKYFVNLDERIKDIMMNLS